MGHRSRCRTAIQLHGNLLASGSCVYPPRNRYRQPTFFGEGNYENEHLAPEYGQSSTTNETLRRTAWWPIAWGSCGHFFGQSTIWQFTTGWQTSRRTEQHCR